MRIGFYWYSATGNTKNLARATRDAMERLGVEVVCHDVLHAKACPHPKEYDKAVFAFPTMVFRTPVAVADFLETLEPFDGEVETWLLVASGGMAAKTDSHFAALAAPKGLAVKGAREFVCEDSYIPFRKYFGLFAKKGAPDDATRAAAEKFAAEIVGGEAMPQGRWSGPLRSFFALIAGKAPRDAAKKFLGPRRLDRDKCDGCKLCVRLCPVGAIHMEDREPAVNESRCVGCLSCFNNCRSGAWRLKRFDVAYHYRCPGESVWSEL